VASQGGLNGAALAGMARMRIRGIQIVYVTGYDVPIIHLGLDGPLLRKPVSQDQLLGRRIRLAGRQKLGGHPAFATLRA
jgi:hypothetical protein